MKPFEKTYRHSHYKILAVFVLLVMGFVGYLFFDFHYYLPLATLGVFILASIYFLTSNVTISESDIISRNLLGSKSLRWNEIARVSMRGQNLRLHNFDGDVTLSIDSRLDEYAKILETIFEKRIDLFELHGNDVTSKRFLDIFWALAINLLPLLLVGFFMVRDEMDWFVVIMFSALGLYLMIAWFLSPWGVEIQGNDLSVKYLYKKVVYPAAEINSITLEKMQTRGGYTYFTQINLKKAKRIKLLGVGNENPLVHRILTRWHKKAMASQMVSGY